MFRSLIRPISLIGAAAGAVLLAGSAAVASPTAVGALAQVAVNPATGAPDGGTVAVSVTGFPADSTVVAGVCTMSDGDPICDPESKVTIETDRNGVGFDATTVQKKFHGVGPDGKPAGSVDCGKVKDGCVVVAATPDDGVVASTPIEFA